MRPCIPKWLRIGLLGLAAATGHAREDEVLDLGLEDLMKLEVTSAGKKSQKISDVPAAVFVITADDIRRSGATSIPDALRMAPGLQVARIDSNKWAVSARGFNGRFANRLLVLMDGRSVYTPTFSGVYWEVQDTLLEDVERIEVIRGPGATLWGANAVNGVINIITKQARDTQGGYASGGGGSVERGFGALRYGAALDDDTYGRAYAKFNRRAGFENIDKQDNGDGWDMGRAGFRIDRQAGDGNAIKLQGDAYEGRLGQTLYLPSLPLPVSDSYPYDTAKVSGMNILGQWRRALSLTSEMSVQAYCDHTYRNENFLREERDTYDLEFQHRFVPWNLHDVLWGLGYRLTGDRFSSRSQLLFGNTSQDRQLFNAFVQDDISLIEHKLKLTLGTKVEHNEFTGFEGQPNLRLAWTPNSRNTLWAAISRAVRTPSRVEDDARIALSAVPPATGLNSSPFPLAYYFQGDRKFRAEQTLAYELGYRWFPRNDLSFDATLFYNEFTTLRSTSTGIPRLTSNGYVEVAADIGNGQSGRSHGAELSAEWHPFDSWTLQATYSHVRLNLSSAVPGSNDLSPDMIEGNTPRHQISLRSGFRPDARIDCDLWLRYVDELPSSGFPHPLAYTPVSSYLTLDARLAWRPLKGLELSATGQNLLDGHHPEFVQETFAPRPTEVPRGFYLRADWHF